MKTENAIICPKKIAKQNATLILKRWAVGLLRHFKTKIINWIYEGYRKVESTTKTMGNLD